jgi:hypothetical protein
MHNFSQLPAPLRDAVRDHCDLVLLFRTSQDNAANVGDFLPDIDPVYIQKEIQTTGTLPDERTMRQHRERRISQLPNRSFYLLDKRKSFASLLVRAPHVEPPHRALNISEGALEQFVDDRRIAEGGAGLSKDTLIGQIERRRARLHEMVRPPITVTTKTQREPETSTASAEETATNDNVTPIKKSAAGKKRAAMPSLGC